MIYYSNPKIPLIYIKKDKVHLVPRKIPLANLSFDYFIDNKDNLFINTFNKFNKPVTLKLNLQGDTISSSISPIELPTNNFTYIMDNVAFSEDRSYIIQEKDHIKNYYIHHTWNRVSYIFNNTKNDVSLPWTNLFFNYFHDKNNNIWLCSPNGLIKISAYKNKFEHYFTHKFEVNKLEYQVRGIYADSLGNVFANIWDKVYKHDVNKKIKNNNGPNEIFYPLVNHKLNLLYWT